LNWSVLLVLYVVNLLVSLSDTVSVTSFKSSNSSIEHSCTHNEDRYFYIDVGDTYAIQLNISGDMEKSDGCVFDFIKVCTI